MAALSSSETLSTAMRGSGESSRFLPIAVLFIKRFPTAPATSSGAVGPRACATLPSAPACPASATCGDPADAPIIPPRAIGASPSAVFAATSSAVPAGSVSNASFTAPTLLNCSSGMTFSGVGFFHASTRPAPMSTADCSSAVSGRSGLVKARPARLAAPTAGLTTTSRIVRAELAGKFIAALSSDRSGANPISNADRLSGGVISSGCSPGSVGLNAPRS